MNTIRKRVLYVISFIILASFVLPSQTYSKSEETVREVLIKYYESVINQNFGIAADYYSVPKTGADSDNPNYKAIENVTSYFNYLYPHSSYELTNFKVLEVMEVNEETYSAKVQLNGIKQGTSDEMSYNQDVLLMKNESSEWRVSIEEYAKYIHANSMLKPIKDLNEEEMLFRFFQEIEAGNYGVAATMISKEMSGLDNKGQSEVISLLKDWAEKLLKSEEYHSAYSLFLLNEFNMEHKDIFLVSATPFRSDEKFSTQSPMYGFIQFDQIGERKYINLTDGWDLLQETSSSSSSKDYADSVFLEMNSIVTRFIIIGIGVLVFLSILSYILSQLGSRSNSSSRYYDDVEREQYYAEERDVPVSRPEDISSSVDRLLESDINKSNMDTTVNKTEVTKLKSDNDVTTGKRRIYLMEESDSGEDCD